jgi:tetratricopeptide (TPR) repeat protein
LLEAGAFEQAIEQFQAVADRSPGEANPWDSLGEGYLANGLPGKALEAYSRALAIDSGFEPSRLGRGLALAALGRYDEALEKESPDFRIQAFLLSRVGRYREAAEVLDAKRRESADAEVNANALLTAAWLLIEQNQYARALEQVRAAESALADRKTHPLLVLADLIGGVADIRAGNVTNAVSRLASQKSRIDSDERVESNWVAALEGEIALAQGRYDQAVSSFEAAQTKVWQVLGRDASTVFVTNLPSRDGLARVEIARGNRRSAIEEYRGLTALGPGDRSSAALEPRHILELAHLLDQEGDEAGARVEYGRFVKLWAHADAGLPELAEAQRALGHLDSATAGR